MKKFSILCPNGHLGYAPIEEGSYRIGLERKPQAICSDSGSCDIGPEPLGSDTPASLERWQRHDISLMLEGARELDVPMIIGSASDTGTNKGVDRYVEFLKDAAAEKKLTGFKLASIRSEIDVDYVRDRLKKGEKIAGLAGFADLDEETLERTDKLVAVMGVEPMIEALNGQADVILTSRTSDCCIFASLCLHRGFDPALSYYMGKVMECASFCAEPYMGKESILGNIDDVSVTVEAMHPNQRCTPASVASHAMYERMDPFTETFAGGSIDMSACEYTQMDEKTTRITGPAYRPADRYYVKLEGAGKVAERAYMIIGLRDPDTIRNVDRAIAWARDKVASLYGKEGGQYQLFYHVYGKNGVMGAWEPNSDCVGHELGLVVEAIAETPRAAKDIATMAARGVFYARLNTKGTAGGVAFLTEKAIYSGSVYEWTVNNIMELADPVAPFPITYETL